MLGFHRLDAVAQVRGRRRRLLEAAEVGGGFGFPRQAGAEDDRDLRPVTPRPLGKREAVVRTGEAGVGAVVEFLAQDVVARHLMMVDRAFFPLFSSAGAKAQ